LKSFNAHITSELGTLVNALETVSLDTFPAEVVTGCFSTLTCSDQITSIGLLLSSLAFAAAVELVMLVSRSPSKKVVPPIIADSSAKYAPDPGYTKCSKGL
jgi:hypothetical protein